MIPLIREYDPKNRIFQQAWQCSLTLFPYEDGNVEDDITDYKRRIFVHGFMLGSDAKEIFSVNEYSKRNKV